jgi:hypothetical protein
VAAAAVLVFTACGDDGRAAGGATTTTPSTTTTTEAPTTTTTEVIDPTTVPDEITAEYVQAVLDELYALRGDATRALVEEKQLNERTVETLSAVYSDSLLTFMLNDISDAVLDGFRGFRDPPGDIVVVVDEVLTGSSECIFVAAVQDFSQVAIEAISPHLSGLTLRPATPEQREAGNPTPWAITEDLFNEDGSLPEDECVA